MTPADAQQPTIQFDPSTFQTFRFTSRELDAHGRVKLGYALDEQIAFVEQYELPLAGELTAAQRQRVEPLLALLHWVAGVSYYKTALPPQIACESGRPGAATAALLEALYSEGLGELAYTNRLSRLPRPRFAQAPPAAAPQAAASTAAATALATAATSAVPAAAAGAGGDGERPLGRVLVPVGGGKDSAVAIEIVRRSGGEPALFSIGGAPPIARTVAAARLPHLLVRRRLDPGLGALNRAGAINGHVPITAIVSCVALLTAALNGFDAVAMANERSASAGNVSWDGIEVNHQFSKSLPAERLLSGALAEADPALRLFSILRPASELAIARAFARLEIYHPAFTSCNAIFRLDPELRAASWCCDCPKCRFVFLVLAPFMEPVQLHAIFGADLLEDESQFDGFALLTASGGHKPFECVGEEQESLAAIRLLAADERWREHRVVRRLAAEVLATRTAHEGDPRAALALSDEHEVPHELMEDVRALLGA